MSYSLPINKIVSEEELLKHLHTRLDRPDAIPFEFKYYQIDWGFCIQHNRLKDFKDFSAIQVEFAKEEVEIRAESLKIQTHRPRQRQCAH
jgi:aminopeptidase-like protein